MAFNHQYPYTDFHELNLDWVLSKVTGLDDRLNEIEHNIELLQEDCQNLHDICDNLTGFINDLLAADQKILKMIASEYDEGTQYDPDFLVRYEGKLYKCKPGQTPGPFDSDYWEETDLGTELGNLIYNYYASLLPHISDMDGNITELYELYNIIGEEYDPNQTYHAGDMCYYEFTEYMCTASGMGTTGPFDPTKWTAQSINMRLRYIESNTEMIVGLRNMIASNYDPSSSYAKGSYVLFNDKIYKAVKNVPVSWPPVAHPTYWEEVTIGSEFNNKPDAVGEYDNMLVGAAKGIYAGNFNDLAPYILRSISGRGNMAIMNKLIGGSVVWNQLVDTDTTDVTIPSGHKYILWNTSILSLATSDGSAVSVSSGYKFYDITQMFPSAVASFMTTALFTKLFPYFAIYGYCSPTILSTKIYKKNVITFNIWDEVWERGSLDSVTGENVEDNSRIRSKNYIKISPSFIYYIKSSTIVGIRFYDKDMVFLGSSYNLTRSNQTFNVPAIARYMRFTVTSTNIYNHDICINISSDRNGEYEPYKSTTYDLIGSHLVKRNYEYRAYASGDESLPDTITDGTNTVTKRTTPTTETVTNPTLYGIWKLDANNNLYFDGDEIEDIPNPQVVPDGGTEEYIDAAVTDGLRDVSIPAGQDTDYSEDLVKKLEDLPYVPAYADPATDGNQITCKIGVDLATGKRVMRHTYVKKGITINGQETISGVIDMTDVDTIISTCFMEKGNDDGSYFTNIGYVTAAGEYEIYLTPWRNNTVVDCYITIDYIEA